MKKRHFVLIFLTVLGLLFSAKMTHTEPSRPVVTSIEIMIRQKGVLYHHVLTDQEKMGMILGYLRATDSPFPAEDLSLDQEQPFHAIRVHLSDGSYHLYEQLANRYFRKDGSAWKAIDPDQGSKLTKLEKFAFSSTL